MAAPDKPEGFRRVLVALDSSAASSAALEVAAGVAASQACELSGLFVEDEDLLRLAELPFAREIQLARAMSRTLVPEQLQRDLRAQRAAGVTRRLVAFEMIDRAIARHGHPVVIDGAPVGVVTSGTQTPTLKKAVGMAMVTMALTAVGSELQIDVRGRCARARVVPEPFYKRPRPARGSQPAPAV